MRYEVELRQEAPRGRGEDGPEPWRPMRRAVRGGAFEPVAFASLAEAREFLKNAPADLARVVGVGEDGGREVIATGAAAPRRPRARRPTGRGRVV